MAAGLTPVATRAAISAGANNVNHDYRYENERDHHEDRNSI